MAEKPRELCNDPPFFMILCAESLVSAPRLTTFPNNIIGKPSCLQQYLYRDTSSYWSVKTFYIFWWKVVYMLGM